MSRRPSLSSFSRQPEPVGGERPTTGAAAPRVSPPIPKTREATGPSIHFPAVGDHRGSSVDVGADFFSAAELAELALPGLPQRREHIARLASKQKWRHREREGRGGGRAFPLAALPSEARAEILRRRMAAESAKNAGLDARPIAPLPIIANLKARQAETLAARSALLAAFDTFKGDGSARASLDTFAQAYNARSVEVAEWCRTLVPSLSRRTLERWLAARNSGDAVRLADNRITGRKSVFDHSPELAEFVLGIHLRQPAIKLGDIARFVRDEYAEGAPDATGLVMALPSASAIARFLNRWKDKAENAALLAAVTDPDRHRAKYRFAIGDAGAGVDRPNQRWQIDASPSDVMCFDGRYSIYVVIDVASRRLLALVSKTPRTTAALLLIARACQTWGVPDEIWTDNGSDFTSKHFVLALRQLGVHHHLTPPFSPERKPFVERAIGTIQSKFMPQFEGYAGNSVAMRSRIEERRAFSQRLGEDEKELLGATIDAVELQRALSAWIANRYERQPHRGLGGRTPLQAWADGWGQNGPRFADPQALGLCLMAPVRNEVRITTKKGVSVDGHDYFHPAMVIGQRVQVRLDPDDLGKVWVYADEDPLRFVGVATNLELEGIDRAQLAARQREIAKAILKEGRAEARRIMGSVDLGAIARRSVGDAPPAAAAPDNVTYLTPALEEAAKALRNGGKRELSPPTDEERERLAQLEQKFSAEPAAEETGSERFARWKKLKAAQDRGDEIPAADRGWFTSYPSTGEWRFHSKIDGPSDGQ